MRIVIQVSARDVTKAWATLVRHSAGVALPNRTFIVSEAAIRALRKNGVRFSEISRDGMAARVEGETAGERV